MVWTFGLEYAPQPTSEMQTGEIIEFPLVITLESARDDDPKNFLAAITFKSDGDSNDNIKTVLLGKCAQ